MFDSRGGPDRRQAFGRRVRLLLLFPLRPESSSPTPELVVLGLLTTGRYLLESCQAHMNIPQKTDEISMKRGQDRTPVTPAETAGVRAGCRRAQADERGAEAAGRRTGKANDPVTRASRSAQPSPGGV